MKELKEITPCYIEEYDINVKPYLTYAEIQNIGNTIVKLKTWAERKQCRDLMVLKYCTDMEEKDYEVGHDVLLMNGVIDAVFAHVNNVDKIDECVDSMESIIHILAKLSTDFVPTLKKTLKKYDNSKQ